MLPILWRYLLRNFFSVFFLCVSTFLGVLLVLRFQEIARFATSGAPKLTILLFALLQMPYILPIAIPTSALIASLLLFRSLSHTHELTAMRSSGLKLKTLTAPIIMAGIFLSLLNFIITNELSPRCRNQSKHLIFEMLSSNPLFLFQKESLIKLKNAYYDIGSLHANKSAENVLFAIKNSSNDRIALMLAKELSLEGDLVKGKQVTLFSSAEALNKGFDHLMIENQQEMNTRAASISQFLQTVDWTQSSEYLSLRDLLAYSQAKNSQQHKSKGTKIEIARRFCISLAAFTFTFLGITYGIQISRNHSKKSMIIVILLATLFLISFITAKSLRHKAHWTLIIYLLANPIIFLCALKSLKSIKEGVE